MLIAQAKKKENLAEYVLYMWQVEDLLRAVGLDVSKIEDSVIKAFRVKPELENEIRFWYENFAESMRVEKIVEKGHLQITKVIIDELSAFHISMLSDSLHQDYLHRFFEIQPLIVELRNKNQDTQLTDIELCFNGLYLLMLLKIKKQTISVETEQAFAKIAKLIALLVKRHKEASEAYSNDIIN